MERKSEKGRKKEREENGGKETEIYRKTWIGTRRKRKKEE